MTCELFIVLPPENKSVTDGFGIQAPFPVRRKLEKRIMAMQSVILQHRSKITFLPLDKFQNSFGIPTPSPVRRKLEPVCSDWFQFLLTTSCCQKQHNPKTEKKAFRPFFRGRVNPPPADSSTLFSFSGGGGGAALE